MFMASQSSSQGWNRAFTDADSVSYSEGETFGVSEGESVGTSLVVFFILLSAFICTWVVKAQFSVNRPDSDVNMSDYADSVGWVSDKSTISSKWILDPEIPDNYLPVPGEEELYMVIDHDGNIIQYRQRTKQEDGSWLWKDVNLNIPANYVAVPGLKDIYKVTAENGTVSYYKYVRNKDDTFAFILVDKDGNPIESHLNDASVIPNNYRRVTGNIYAVLNDPGVVIGYKERRMKDEKYVWVDTSAPEIKKINGQTSLGDNRPKEDQKDPSPTISQNPSGGEQDGTTNTQQGNDGTYTQTETLISTETAGGWVTTYQTVITRVYNERGVLLSTKKSDPVLLSRVKAGENSVNAPDPSKIAPTLNEEYARVSVGINYKTEFAADVLKLINEEQKAEGLAPLKMSEDSAAKLAKTRSADMAIYDHSDFDSPTYGLLSEMISRFRISSGIPSEHIWKTTASKNAGAIYARFMAFGGSRKALMDSSYTEMGIGIAQKNGYYYICIIMVN